jgi:hypothetical protein
MRLYLFRKDIEQLEGVGEKAAQQLMRDIRETYGLNTKRKIPVKHYCMYCQLYKADVPAALEALSIKKGQLIFLTFLLVVAATHPILAFHLSISNLYLMSHIPVSSSLIQNLHKTVPDALST